MLYIVDNKLIRWMSGAEKYDCVYMFKKKYPDKKQRQYFLRYIYFAYAKKCIFENVLPSERRDLVINHFDLFPEIPEKKEGFWKEIEEKDTIREIIDIFIESQYSTNERHKLLYLEKVEKYEKVLRDPEASLEQEIEANKGVTMYRRLINDIDLEIQREEEDESDAVPLHFFEIPDRYIGNVIT